MIDGIVTTVTHRSRIRRPGAGVRRDRARCRRSGPRRDRRPRRRSGPRRGRPGHRRRRRRPPARLARLHRPGGGSSLTGSRPGLIRCQPGPPRFASLPPVPLTSRCPLPGPSNSSSPEASPEASPKQRKEAQPWRSRSRIPVSTSRSTRRRRPSRASRPASPPSSASPRRGPLEHAAPWSPASTPSPPRSAVRNDGPAPYYLPLAVEGFFRNGGTMAFVIRDRDSGGRHRRLCRPATPERLTLASVTGDRGRPGRRRRPVTVTDTSALATALTAAGAGTQ